MKLKKTTAALGLFTVAGMLVHIGYTVFAYLAFYYNPALKVWTAVPATAAVCLHAVCGMLSLFLHADGSRLSLYPRQNLRTLLQRVTAALMFPLLILHIKTFALLTDSAEAGQWFAFALLMLSQPLFYGVVLTHIAVSFSRALVTLGWLTSPKAQRTIDLVVYVLCGVAFVISTYVVVSTELAMFLPGGTV